MRKTLFGVGNCIRAFLKCLRGVYDGLVFCHELSNTHQWDLWPTVNRQWTNPDFRTKIAMIDVNRGITIMDFNNNNNSCLHTTIHILYIIYCILAQLDLFLYTTFIWSPTNSLEQKIEISHSKGNENKILVTLLYYSTILITQYK